MNINKYHIYFWLFFLSFFILLDYLQYPKYTFIQRELYMAFLQLCIFYSFLFALFKFKTGTLVVWAKSISLFVLSFAFIMFLNYWRGKLAALYGAIPHGTFYMLLFDTIRLYSTLAFFATGYYYLKRYGLKQKELKLLAEEKAAQDVAKAQLAVDNAELAAHNAGLRQNLLEAENSFLRAQVNPHFLYNTLNLFYAQALPLSKPLANNIVVLAEIMRYSLEATESNTLVPLRMEVDQLERVLALHQLRFGGKLHIALTINGQSDGINVAPLVFITLLENALKHGELNDPAAPVTLWLATDDSQIYFTIRNKKSTDPPEHSHGIGLHNIKKRLHNIYDDDYRIVIDDTADWFEVMLTIKYSGKAKAGYEL
jgi:two-component system, LytTR family, sensor kinase